ncbi:MAG: hypothetical protein MIO92_05915 [Methanosarcinaceae archaeon]|nr:hypothetical protein [Methanosarcinaceae archaeon]
MRLRQNCIRLLAFCVCLSVGTHLGAQTTRRVNLPPGNLKEVKKIGAAGVFQIDTQLPSVLINSQELLFEHIEGPVIKLSSETLNATRDLNGISRTSLGFNFYTIQNGTNLDLKTIVDMEPSSGLRYSPDASVFECTLYIGLYDNLNPGATGQLPQAVDFLIIADVEHNPATITIDHINLPFATVSLSSKAPREPVKIKIRPSFSSELKEFEVGIDRPVLRLEVSPSSISGLGLEEANITIQGKDMQLAPGIPLTLTTSKGGLKSPNVVTNDVGIATSKIRSISFGTALIRADSPRFLSVETKLKFRFPWVFILVAFVGGLVGTVAQRTRKFTLKNIIAGLALGMLAGVGTAIGVNVLGFELNPTVGEALTFFVAGVCSYIGRLVLPRSS